MFISNNSIIFLWSEFRDFDSDICSCNILVLDKFGYVFFLEIRNILLGNVFLIFSVGFFYGESYNVSVECVNNVGFFVLLFVCFIIDNILFI